jgi:hypothetical protein
MDLRVLYATPTGDLPADAREAWRRLAGTSIDLTPLRVADGDVVAAVRGYVERIPRGPDDFITVIVPELVRERLPFYLVRRRALVRLKSGLLREPNVVVADAPVPTSPGAGSLDGRPLIPTRTVALVFVSAVHDSTIRAVNYALSLGASETRAIYFDMEPEAGNPIAREWADRGLAIPLDIVEAPFRDLEAPMLDEIRRFTARRDTLCSVVIPEVVVPKWRHLLLHNQHALFVKRLLLYEPNVVLSSVPFVLHGHQPADLPLGGDPAERP